MRTVSLLIESYKVDYGRYPSAASLDEFAPIADSIYKYRLPKVDAWGADLVLRSNRDGFRVLSSGPDKVFHPSTLAGTGGIAGDDLVLENGRFLTK